jgi:hypothetical protein
VLGAMNWTALHLWLAFAAIVLVWLLLIPAERRVYPYLPRRLRRWCERREPILTPNAWVYAFTMAVVGLFATIIAPLVRALL